MEGKNGKSLENVKNRHLSNWMIFARKPIQVDSREEMSSCHFTAQAKSIMLRYNGFNMIG